MEKVTAAASFFFFLRWLLLSSSAPKPFLSAINKNKHKQEESRRAERESRTMSERTVDAQRASAPVPRYVFLLG